MLKNLQDGFIDACNLVKIIYEEYIILDGETIYIKGNLKDDCYEDGNIIGTFIFKELQFETDNIKIFKNKEFTYYKKVNGISQKIGTFITTEVNDNDTQGTVKVTAMDYGLKTQKLYESSLNYESEIITLLDVYNEACTLAGIQAGNIEFTNSDFIVDSDQFTGTGITIRDVFKNIALASCSFVKVMNDDKIYLMLEEQTDEIIEEYTDLQDKRDTQPITCVSMGMSNIEGQDITRKDTALIEQYGENWLKINDCRFAYTEAKRIQLIDNIFNKIKGFGYSSFVSKTSFKPYLTCGDRIQFRNREGNLVNSIILRYNHENVEINLEAPSIIKSTVDYENPKKEIDLIKKTEYFVDQQNQIIESVVNNVTVQNNKISQITQTVDEINRKISDVADITTTAESSTSRIELDRINESEPILLKVHPVVTNISYLYPRANLYPSNNLFMTVRTIRFIRTYEEEETTYTENIDYELPDDLLYYNSEVYDEFYLDYDSQTCQVTKRCKYNADGTVGLLETPQVVNYPYPTINLGNGNYEILILGYATGYIKATLMSQNIYTTQFYTKAETNSLIDQTTNNIDLSVNQKLTNYNTKNEVEAKLMLKIGKDDNDQIISMINQSADIISLNSNRLIINSTNFKLNSEGNITATGGTIGGFTLSHTQFLSNINGIYDYNGFDLRACMSDIMDYIDGDTILEDIWNTNNDKKIDAMDFYNIQQIILGNLTNTKEVSGTFILDTENPKRCIRIRQGYTDAVAIGLNGIEANLVNANNLMCGNVTGSSYNGITMNGNTGTLSFVTSNNTRATITKDGDITCVSLTQTSLEEAKKNFEKLENGLDIVKATDIYKYNLKGQKDTDKKHIGFVIGDSFNYSSEITALDKERKEIGVDTYSMISVAYKAIQELAEKIEKLEGDN